MTKVTLTNGDGGVLGELPSAAEDVLARAEQHARAHHLSKRSYFPVAVRQEIEAAGYRVADKELDAAMAQLDALRRGERVEHVRIRVTPAVPRSRPTPPGTQGDDMASTPPLSHRFFESERTYPNADARAWY